MGLDDGDAHVFIGGVVDCFQEYPRVENVGVAASWRAKEAIPSVLRTCRGQGAVVAVGGAGYGTSIY